MSEATTPTGDQQVHSAIDDARAMLADGYVTIGAASARSLLDALDTATARAVASETTLARLHSVALRYVTAWRAEGAAKVAWRAGCRAEQCAKDDSADVDYDGPLTAAYDDAIDERIVAMKLLARLVSS